MRCLLDTHTFLWWAVDDPRLTERTRAIIEDTNNDVFLSAVSVWEIAIKAHLGRIDLVQDPEAFITTQLVNNNFLQLPITLRHAIRVFSLPPIHRDPFDRLLIAQAITDELTLLSQDSLINRYDAPVIW